MIYLQILWSIHCWPSLISRLPLEAPEDEIEEIVVEQQSKEKNKKENVWEPEREADGTYQIKKNFENTKMVAPDQVNVWKLCLTNKPYSLRF